MKSVNWPKPGYASITCSTISNIPYNLIFATKYNDSSILITIISCDYLNLSLTDEHVDDVTIPTQVIEYNQIFSRWISQSDWNIQIKLNYLIIITELCCPFSPILPRAKVLYIWLIAPNKQLHNNIQILCIGVCLYVLKSDDWHDSTADIHIFLFHKMVWFMHKNLQVAPARINKLD
jgi:hypothetical protein